MAWLHGFARGAFVMMDMDLQIVELASKVKLLVLDCDGVLTDGALHYVGSTSQSEASEVSVGLSFYAQDGHAMKMLMRSGVEIAIISGRGSAALDYRMRELGIKHALSRIADKHAALNVLMEKLNLASCDVAVMGDDLPDLALFENACLSFAPADAHPVVRERAQHVTEAAGGRGAVRDVAMLILQAQSKFELRSADTP